MPPLPAALALGALLAVVLAWSGVAGFRYWRRRRAARALRARFESISFDLLRDVLLPDGSGGVLQVDWLLFTPRGLLVVDLRTVRGMIFGSELMDQWVAMDGARRLELANPTGPMFDRIAVVRQLAGELPVDGRIIFADGASFPKGQPPWAMLLSALEAEFPAIDRAAGPAAPAGWPEAWAQVRSAAKPSPVKRRV